MAASASAEPKHHTSGRRTTSIDLRDLPVGSAPTSLYSAGEVIHDGDVSVPVGLSGPMRLVGRVAGGYVVETSTPSGLYGKLFLVDPATGAAARLGRTTDLERVPHIVRSGRDLAYDACCAAQGDGP